MEQKATKFKMTVTDYFHLTGKPSYPMLLDADVFDRAADGAEQAEPPPPPPQQQQQQHEDPTRPFVEATAPAPSNRFHALKQLLTTHVAKEEFVGQLKEFVNEEKEPGWSDVVAAGIGAASTTEEVCAALPAGAPWSLSRSAADLGGISAANLVGSVVLNVGQVAPFFDGHDFLTTPVGSSVVVRLAMRAADVDDASCCCIEALPININFQDLARCDACTSFVAAVVRGLPHVSAGDGVAPADVAPADVAPADDDGHPDSERYPTDEPVRLVPASVAQCRLPCALRHNSGVAETARAGQSSHCQLFWTPY